VCSLCQFLSSARQTGASSSSPFLLLVASSPFCFLLCAQSQSASPLSFFSHFSSSIFYLPPLPFSLGHSFSPKADQITWRRLATTGRLFVHQSKHSFWPIGRSTPTRQPPAPIQHAQPSNSRALFLRGSQMPRATSNGPNIIVTHTQRESNPNWPQGISNQLPAPLLLAKFGALFPICFGSGAPLFSASLFAS